MSVLFMVEHVAKLTRVDLLTTSRASVEVGGIRNVRRDNRDGIELPAARAGGPAHRMESLAGRTRSVPARLVMSVLSAAPRGRFAAAIANSVLGSAELL